MTKGWVPADIPNNVIDISEAHDIDTNETWMKFRLDIGSSEAQEFFATWRPLAPQDFESIEAPMRLRWWNPPRNLEDSTLFLERSDGPRQRCRILATPPDTVYFFCSAR